MDPSPSPPPNLPPGGGWAEGPEEQWGGVPSTGLGGPTYCAASRASMAVLSWTCPSCSHHPYLYLGPAPWGGRGAGMSSASSKIPSGRGSGEGAGLHNPLVTWW